MMDMLMSIVRETPHLITSPLVFNDIRNLEIRNGKIQAIKGLHDDSIMSYLITRWAIAYTPYFKNKKIIGGMLTKDILTEGTKTYSGMDLQTSGFNSVLAMDSPIARVGGRNKQINTTGYAKEAEERQQQQQDPEQDTRRKKFSNFLSM
jgi:hypothetical protein